MWFTIMFAPYPEGVDSKQNLAEILKQLSTDCGLEELKQAETARQVSIIKSQEMDTAAAEAEVEWAVAKFEQSSLKRNRDLMMGQDEEEDTGSDEADGRASGEVSEEGQVATTEAANVMEQHRLEHLNAVRAGKPQGVWNVSVWIVSVWKACVRIARYRR